MTKFVDPDRYLNWSIMGGHFVGTLHGDHGESAQISLDRSAIEDQIKQLTTLLGTDPAATRRPAIKTGRRRPGARLDKDGAEHVDDVDDVPTLALSIAAERVAAYKKAHNGHYPPAPFDAGQNSDRQSVGQPGHCSVCAVLGHVVAHPERGCGNVQCNSDHEAPGQITRHECTLDGKALPFGRKAPIGDCLRCDQLRAGAAPREAHPAIRAAATRRSDDDQRAAEITAHFAPGGPHSQGACGPVCTFGQW